MRHVLPALLIVACTTPEPEDTDTGDTEVRDTGDDTDTEAPYVPPEPTVVGDNVPGDFLQVVEAEHAVLSGGATIEIDADASGGQEVLLRDDGIVDFTVEVPTTGVYALQLRGRSPYGFGTKWNVLRVDGEEVATFKTLENPQHYPHPTQWAWMQQGQHTVSIESWWGWAAFDRLEVLPVAPDYLDVPPDLVIPYPSDATERLMRYLVDHYGVTTLAGQQNADSLEPLAEITGREPAVLAVDFINYCPSRLFGEPPPSDDATEDAIAWSRRGGVVSISWHWNAPTDLLDTTWTDSNGNEVDARWYKGFYTYATTFDLEAALADPQSERYGLLLRDIDAIAVQLQKLEDADVPVLWRPLHEAAGGWFWWGAKGPEPFLGLWELLYDRLVHHHGLDNLIWVWNGQHEDWYPGDDRADVIAEDIYGEKREYSTFASAFGRIKNYGDSAKLIALSESGTLPDPDHQPHADIPWSWFNIWSGDAFVTDQTWNEHEVMESVYAHERVITLEELPDLTRY